MSLSLSALCVAARSDNRNYRNFKKPSRCCGKADFNSLKKKLKKPISALKDGENFKAPQSDLR